MRVRKDRGGAGELDVYDNPRIFGTDVATTAEAVAGLVLTAVLNDKVLSPLVRGVTAGVRNSSNALGQLVDAGTTLLAAQVVSMAASRFFGAATARQMAFGGGLYGIGKAVTSIIPGVSISAQYPDFLQSLSIWGPTAPAAALGAGAAAPMPSQAAEVLANDMGF